MTIPVFNEAPSLSALCQDFLRELASSFKGEINTSYASRLVNATDNSVYQVLPQAVLSPKDEQDVQRIFKLAAEERYSTVHFSARGGGTGTNGQSLNNGIVIDVAREQRSILELNLSKGCVRVQPGVILDQLNDYLKPHGVFFAPNLSPSNRATIGGMANTDACGKGSRIYGRTSDHVKSMRVVLNDGTVIVTGRKTAEQLSNARGVSSREKALYQHVREACEHAPIHPGAERLGRFITAYNLWKPLSEDGSIALDPVICGSEGTLAIVTELTLKLTPLPKHKGLFAIRFRSFDLALSSAQSLLGHEPSAIETIDDKILTLAKEDVLFPKVKPYLGVDEDYSGNAVNLVEFIADNSDALSEKTAALKQWLAQETGVVSFYYTTESTAQAALWELRKKGVGLLGNAKGKRRPIPFVEDTAVPPEHLADYIREFRTLLDSHGLSYGMFGHVDVGCLHVRPALNMRTEDDNELFKTISDGVYALLKKYGGVMWSEHGKGFRSWYGPDFHGDEIYRRMRQVKTAFDPKNQLNPGKICAPINSENELYQPFTHWRGVKDSEINSDAEKLTPGALYCNGNGQCFDFRMDSIMCPSYKASNNRVHSPKGRSGLMREWLTVAGQRGIPLQAKPHRFVQKLRRELRRFTHVQQSDFSHEVAEAMNGCLGCKACVTQCPIKVDVPAQKALFLHHYHGRYPRKMRDYLLSTLDSWAPFAARFPKLSNALLLNPVARWLSEKCFGLSQLPAFASQNVYRYKELFYSEQLINNLSEVEKRNTVFLCQDPFTSFFDEESLASAVRLLTALDLRVIILPFIPFGKAAHVKGMLPRFERIAKQALSRLAEFARHDIPVIVLESTQALMLSQEFSAYTSDYTLPKIMPVHEFLVSRQWQVSNSVISSAALFSHCTEKSQLGNSASQWQAVFRQFGVELKTVSTGCCGMAGSYGHESEHQQLSQTLWQQSWNDSVATAKVQGSVCATGFSCREQSAIQTGQRLASPLKILADIIDPIG